LNKNEHRPASRVLDILELLSSCIEGLTLTEIANSIGVPKSSISPYIHTLCDRNFISINEQNSKYVIGINAFLVGSAYLKNFKILPLIKDEMQNIVNTCLETCQLGIINHGNVLYIEKVDSPKSIRLISSVGRCLPAYCTALGKALICDYSEEKLRNLYHNELKPYTKNTITDFKILQEQLKNIQKTNIALESEEVMEQIMCIAVPFRKDGQVILSMSIAIPLFRKTSEKVMLAEKLLIQAKDKIENLLDKINIDTNSFNQINS
jgi:IclR family KDG regulon transcriptional repressor